MNKFEEPSIYQSIVRFPFLSFSCVRLCDLEFRHALHGSNKLVGIPEFYLVVGTPSAANKISVICFFESCHVATYSPDCDNFTTDQRFPKPNPKLSKGKLEIAKGGSTC